MYYFCYTQLIFCMANSKLAVKETNMAKPLFSFRFDPDLMKELEKLAKKENRSLTNFIETELFKIVEESKKKKK